MDLFDSQLRRLQRDTARLQRLGLGLTAAMHQPLLFGRRAIFGPAIALQNDLSMGPARHLLSQMVVAGTVTFLPSFPPAPTRREPGPAPDPGDAPSRD